ncbi:MAG: (deoxy)nucleoside triphosphate pyrophosphohydrolase [Rhodospirillales bacterium]|nr:(deoxy)nucleoside triphosphate pyrophosphohydrolase [Alphaproteobacteria bacterium]USO06686.1 MAG: (deoxy)nucleoside triphosphate pyrophosphohydrolase [Rhodospirillales bacterium]
MHCDEALKLPKPTLPNLPIILVTAAALINPRGEIFIARRPEGKPMAGLWEFPGGKVDEGETPEFALMRELEEELGIETRPTCYHPIAFASHSYDDFHLLMPLFACRKWRGDITLNEHQDGAWVKPVDMLDYPMPAADLPLVTTLRDLL